VSQDNPREGRIRIGELASEDGSSAGRLNSASARTLKRLNVALGTTHVPVPVALDAGAATLFAKTLDLCRSRVAAFE
jgi:hypothetical protein